MQARAVIGALYGDEGKGLMTDYFAHQAMEDHGSCIVVRSNGGAQAAHTVQTPDGKRHVFHHFGSGTLAGASTHLSRFMIVNPIMFNREWNDLAALGVEPRITMSPNCQLTMPQDMLMNQMFETMRGDARHGSCGLGIGETIERVEKHRCSCTIDHWKSMQGDWRSLRAEVEAALNARLMNLNLRIEDLPNDFSQYLRDDAIFANFIEECNLMLQRAAVLPDRDVSTRSIIFEAAQGLALDEHMGWFPYVTRSKTGMFNIAALCKDMGISEIETVYVMRAYTTRHGAGPLDGDDIEMEGFDLTDPTNQPNDWQGALRYAPLDMWLAKRLTDLDLAGHRNRNLQVTKSVAVTCFDQIPDLVRVFHDNRSPALIAKGILLGEVMFALGAENGWSSHGPTRDTVFEELGLVT